jgi:hypothetical protein
MWRTDGLAILPVLYAYFNYNQVLRLLKSTIGFLFVTDKLNDVQVANLVRRYIHVDWLWRVIMLQACLVFSLLDMPDVRFVSCSCIVVVVVVQFVQL